MIFFDESGKRWKRIKNSTFVLAVLGSVPVAALIMGGLIYQPQWGIIAGVKYGTGVVLANTAKLSAQSPATPTPKPTSAPPARKTTPANQLVAYRASSTSIASEYSLAAAPIAPSTPTPTPTPPPTAQLPTSSPAAVNPTQNDDGQAHRPIH